MFEETLPKMLEPQNVYTVYKSTCIYNVILIFLAGYRCFERAERLVGRHRPYHRPYKLPFSLRANLSLSTGILCSFANRSTKNLTLCYLMDFTAILLRYASNFSIRLKLSAKSYVGRLQNAIFYFWIFFVQNWSVDRYL